MKRTGYAPIEKYNKKTYDALKLRVKKGEREIIKARAAQLGKSLNGYVYGLIKEDLEKNK